MAAVTCTYALGDAVSAGAQRKNKTVFNERWQHACLLRAFLKCARDAPCSLLVGG